MLLFAVPGVVIYIILIFCFFANKSKFISLPLPIQAFENFHGLLLNEHKKLKQFKNVNDSSHKSFKKIQRIKIF